MSIFLLQKIAGQRLPLNVHDKDQMVKLRVLMEAGLIAAFQVRSASNLEGVETSMIRILAVTCDGRRLLHRRGESAALDV